MKKTKKGFTIVELVIVIAVVAVLTAVLIPTFVHLSRKAKDATDKTTVKNANIQLATREGLEGKNRSMSEAVKDVDEIGYHMSGITSSNGNKILWDSVADRFVLLDKNGNVLLKDSETVASDDKLFKAISNIDEREGKYAIYAKSDYNGPTSFTDPISFDTGDKEGIEEVKYTLGPSDTSTVTVATNSIDTDLTVYGPAATFNHVGLVGNEYVLAAAPESFHEFGKAAFAKVDIGHYVAEPGAVVKAVYTTSNASIIDRNGGTIEKAYGSEAAVTNPEGNVVLEPYDSDVTMEKIQEDAYDDLDHEINPPEPAGPVEVTQTNYSTVFTPDEHEYILAEDIQIMIRAFTIPEDCDVVLDLNGHNITCNYDDFDLDAYYDHVGDEAFMDTVSCVVNFGALSIIGDGEIGGPGGWFGIYNHGELTLNGCKLIGGKVTFALYGVTVALSPYGSTSGATLNADGYRYYNNNTAYDGYTSGKSATWTFEPERA